MFCNLSLFLSVIENKKEESKRGNEDREMADGDFKDDFMDHAKAEEI